MLSNQGVDLFERIRRIRRYSLIGVTLLEEVFLRGAGFELSKAHARPPPPPLCLRIWM